MPQLPLRPEPNLHFEGDSGTLSGSLSDETVELNPDAELQVIIFNPFQEISLISSRVWCYVFWVPP